MPTQAQQHLAAPAMEAVITIARPGINADASEDIVRPITDLAPAVADLEKLHNAVETHRAGGPGSSRGYQFLDVFDHYVKPAYVLGAALRIAYPKL